MRRSPITADYAQKLEQYRHLSLGGGSRWVKGLLAAAIAQERNGPLLVIAPTMEEAGRWAAQMESLGTVWFYPTSTGIPYDALPMESEVVWGQMQVLSQGSQLTAGDVVVATERALQVHLPSPRELQDYCLTLHPQDTWAITELGERLTQLGYERVSLVETEGQWSRRGDIVDIYPVANELPVRLDWLGDTLEKIREFDPVTQRALDAIATVTLTPTGYGLVYGEERSTAVHPRSQASLLDYLPPTTLVAIDEPEQCAAHTEPWLEAAARAYDPQWGAPLHRSFDACWTDCAMVRLDLRELGEPERDLALAARGITAAPRQFGALAQMIRDYRDQGYRIALISAQPLRTVALLQEHDCMAEFVLDGQDFARIEKLWAARMPVALKYAGTAELPGFVLPPMRLLVLGDREFFGQHHLTTYVRKRRPAASKQVDPNKLSPGDFVVHRHHGIGRFLRLEPLTVNHETREYLVIQYADGLLRVAVDQMSSLSRYRATQDQPPPVHKMGSKAWASTTNKVRKSVRKLAFDLLELYARRSQQVGFAFPSDGPWQVEMEESFAYQPTPDQLKATADVKRDMELPYPMDRLVCGDVGFGKTEVALRAIFKAAIAGKQVALLAPTTILTQQHYHTLQERFAPYPLHIALLNRFKTPSERKEILQKLKTGELDIVVGTHQILSKEVHFKELGLLVIDEEQRFGVSQKEKIKALRTQVDVLTLTATPIPRTLHMALSGVREMSLITTPPPSRRAIKTHLMRYSLDAVRLALRQELDRGGQIFYVTPRIEGMEETAAALRTLIPSLRMAIAHGQMPEAELESTMLAFHNGEADLLLCTTIVESGLDIPRVNTILIEDAQKFGLAQLYQLRGRVGRGGIQAHAWLFYQEKGELSEPARQRLRAIQEFTQLGSGYQLALRDMEIRGVGSLLGAEQSGQMEAIGFDLYMQLLQEAMNEIRGSEIPEVDDTQIDLPVTAFLPSDYISDGAQKLSAYRAIASASSRRELEAIAEEWRDRFGPTPTPARQLLQVMELKLLARRIACTRIKPSGKQDLLLETNLQEPAWHKLHQRLPEHLKGRFVYQGGKVTVRGLGVMAIGKQMEHLITSLEQMTTEIVA
jgi:transcription-repair coupling factor (superfamily II helicase)